MSQWKENLVKTQIQKQIVGILAWAEIFVLMKLPDPLHEISHNDPIKAKKNPVLDTISAEKTSVARRNGLS